MSICQSRVTIKRQTSELFDSQVASSSITVSRNPNTTATVQVKKEGTATAGTFTITGTIVEYDANNTPSSTAVSETLSRSLTRTTGWAHGKCWGHNFSKVLANNIRITAK